MPAAIAPYIFGNGINLNQYLLLATTALLAPLAAHAQKPNYPERPIRMIVPYPPGGGGDVIARAISPQLSQALGRQVTVDNRPGGAAMIGTEIVVKSPADGYTLLMTTPAPITVNPGLYRKMPYDPLRDLAPISLLASYSTVLTTHPSLPVRTVKELITFAKARPGQIHYSSGGNGTTQHLSGEMLKTMAGIDIVHVPYKGGGPSFIDLMAGNVSVTFASPGLVLPFADSGRVTLLAVSSAKRSPAFPNLPAVAETLPGFEAVAWVGLFAPRGTPREIITLLQRESVKILQAPQVLKILAAQNLEVAGNSPEEFAAYVKEDHDRWAKVIARAGAKAD